MRKEWTYRRLSFSTHSVMTIFVTFTDCLDFVLLWTLRNLRNPDVIRCNICLDSCLFSSTILESCCSVCDRIMYCCFIWIESYQRRLTSRGCQDSVYSDLYVSYVSDALTSLPLPLSPIGEHEAHHSILARHGQGQYEAVLSCKAYHLCTPLGGGIPLHLLDSPTLIPM